MRRTALPGLLLAVLTLGWVGTAQPPAADADTCSGVWVVVDYGSLGGISTSCTTSFGTGAAALRGAGFGPTLDSGMVTEIGGKPTKVDLKDSYWSYWHATAKSDGSYSGWSYSNLGATAYHPSKGNAEGWRYQSLTSGKVAPGATPPKAEVSLPKPSPTPTPTTTKPKATTTPKASAKPSTTTTRASASPKATASPTEPTTSAPQATLTPSVAATPTNSPVAPILQPANAGTTGETGSPVGALVAGGLIVAGGAGVGGWWLLKGRRP